MGLIKTVWEFSTAGNTARSFSEVLAFNGANIQAVAASILPVVATRLDLLHPLNRLRLIRLSDVQNARVTSIVGQYKAGTAPTPAGSSPNPYNVAVVMQISAINNPPGQRKMWMRGTVDADAFESSNSGNDVFDAGFHTRVNDWISSLITAGCIILTIHRPSETGYGWHKVVSVDSRAQSGTAIVTTVDNHGFQQNDYVTFGSMSKKDFPALVGRFQVLAQTATTFTIPYEVAQGNIVNATKGRVRKWAYLGSSVIDFNSSGESYISSRKSRSPFTNSRGARRAERGLRLAT